MTLVHRRLLTLYLFKFLPAEQDITLLQNCLELHTTFIYNQWYMFLLHLIAYKRSPSMFGYANNLGFFAPPLTKMRRFPPK